MEGYFQDEGRNIEQMMEQVKQTMVDSAREREREREREVAQRGWEKEPKEYVVE